MKRSLFLVFLTVFVFTFTVAAQKNRRRPPVPIRKTTVVQAPPEVSNTAVVVDERLAVLRAEPSLYARPLVRMRRGRIVAITGSREADGVTFFRVSVPPGSYGWVQSEAVAGKFKRGDDQRLANLIQASDGFEQLDRAQLFLETFPASPLRAPILLLYGDLIEENAAKISQDAARKLNKREMAATGAPVHSFYLNYTSLDRFKKMGVNFLFNPNTKTFHYDGAAWKEILAKFPKSSEAGEAQKRLDALKEKLERVK